MTGGEKGDRLQFNEVKHTAVVHPPKHNNMQRRAVTQGEEQGNENQDGELLDELASSGSGS